MRISSSDNTAHKTALCGLLLCLALIFSYIEARLPLLFIPIPGCKLGFANLVIALTAYMISLPAAAIISILRVLISSVLFGSLTSFWFSLLGALYAFAVLALLLRFASRTVSPLGVSVASAAAHNLGQLSAAAVLLSPTVLSYTPVLLLAALITGSITGLILCRLLKSTQKIFKLHRIIDSPTQKGHP